jgi:hypothetical protein
MKKNILSKFVIVSAMTFMATGHAQVGIGTNSPNSSAKLEVSATDKGFLPPRVTLTGTTDVATIASPATGLLVYNTATAGTSPNNVTPGFYYYDGSKWQRLITQQPDATVEFSVNANPNTGGTTFSPNTPSSKDYIYVSTIDNSQWTWNGTAYVTYTPPASTAWYSQSSTNDAGSNKTSGIFRTGNLGIGTSSFTPAAKLDIRASSSGTGFRLVDGSQGANKVLQSDANGYASWATNVSVTAAVIGTRGTGAANTGANSYTGAYITLPPGKWSVSVSMLGIILTAGNFWVQTGFSASSTSIVLGADGVAGGPVLISGLVVGNANNMINGTVVINNTSGANKTYYYCTASTAGQTLTNLGRDTYGENTIIAYPMN